MEIFQSEKNWVIKIWTFCCIQWKFTILTQIQLFHLSHILIWYFLKIWIVQNYYSDEGWTQFRRVFIVNFTITDKKTVHLVKALKRVIVENFATDTLQRVADNIFTRAKLCILEEGGHFEYMLKKKKWANWYNKKFVFVW